MLAVLTEAQKVKHEKCWDAAEELSDLMEWEANGFYLAVKIMTEVLETMEIPSVDE